MYYVSICIACFLVMKIKDIAVKKRNRSTILLLGKSIHNQVNKLYSNVNKSHKNYKGRKIQFYGTLWKGKLLKLSSQGRLFEW